MTAFGRRPRQDPLVGLPPELQRVLGAAAAPGRPSELEGLTAATAAFTCSSTSATRPERAVSWFVKLATPVVAVVTVTGMTGGVALAAATGSLPDSVQQLASNLGAPAPDSDDEVQRPATATATIGTGGRGRCVAVTMGAKQTRGRALQASPLAAAVANGCPTKAAPGSNRSATATAVLKAKPARPAKPAKPKTAARPAKPEKAAKPAKPEKPVTPAKPVRPAGAGKPAEAGKPSGAGKSAVRSTGTGRPDEVGKPAR